MNTLSLRSIQGPPTSTDALDTALRKTTGCSRVDDDVVASNARQHYLAAQSALRGRDARQARRREWAAAAVGMVWLLVSFAALLAAFCSYAFP